MSGNGYLFAAYAVTWIIHITYLGTIVRRYKRLQGEIEDLKKPGGSAGVSPAVLPGKGQNR
jgi:CcmD family protein